MNGWAVSSTGTIIHTTNGGSQWNIQTTISNFYPEKIVFRNLTNGWIAGTSNRFNEKSLILKTVDGGENWTTSFFLDNSKLFDIFFLNDTMGWAVGFRDDTIGLRLHTVNAGQEWKIQIIGINVATIYSSVHFRNTSDGDLCGPGPILMHTNNGGREIPGWGLDLKKLEKPMYDLVNVGTIYGCMVGADGKLIFTKDNWANFIEYTYTGNDTLWSVDAIEPLGFWVAGEAGTILFIGYNAILGYVVQDHSRAIPSDLFEVDAVDAAHVWAVGEEGTILKYSFNYDLGYTDQKVKDIFIFPNPATDYIWLQKKSGDAGQFRIYSTSGQLIKEIHFQKGESNLLIDLSDLNAGIYILKSNKVSQSFVIGK
jgi:photosystem II stability/assembly factor-like uncharacterized protein